MHNPYESKFVGDGPEMAHYLEHGSGEPVVLVHGGGAGADSLTNYFEVIGLFGQDRRVLAVDMLGFGNSAMPSPAEFEYSMSARTDHLEAFLRNLDLEPSHLVGNSMGGASCIELAMRSPALVRSLTVMGTAGRAKKMDINTNPNVAPLLNYDGTEAGMRAILAALTADFEPPAELVEYRVAQSIRPEAIAAYRATMGWVRENGMTFGLEDFAKLQVPMHVVHGRHDAVVPLSQALEIVEHTPNASMTLFGQLGHLVMIENPLGFVEAVTSFWRDLDRHAVGAG